MDWIMSMIRQTTTTPFFTFVYTPPFDGEIYFLSFYTFPPASMSFCIESEKKSLDLILFILFFTFSTRLHPFTHDL